MVMRLDKLLAHYGIGTRKEVKNYIRKGFVTVNGSIIKKDDFKVDYETDKIINVSACADCLMYFDLLLFCRIDLCLEAL